MNDVAIKYFRRPHWLAHNKLFLNDQGQVSRRLLAQPTRQFTLAPEQGRYVAGQIMSWLQILGIVFLSLVAMFWYFDWNTKRSYKPTKSDLKSVIERTLDDSIDLGKFDEISSVPIHYSVELESIRKKYVEIVNNPNFIDREITRELVVPLSPEGKSKLRRLLGELEALAT
ncbi:MAG: hypothetical protein R3F50_04715 [Gammaproteobacteria bacterium]